MNIFRITIIAVPLIVASSSAFADSGEKRKQSTAPPAPTEEPKAETPPPAQIETPPPAPAPSPPPATPPVGTTQTTAAYTETREAPIEAPKGNPAGDRWSLEPLIGFGTNDYNFGVGGRAGYTFKVPIYVGATFMWHAGETTDFVSANTFGEAKRTFYYPGMEVGYDINIGKRGSAMIRPYAGAAILYERERIATPFVNVTDTSNAFMLYPGLTARYNIANGPVFVGADTRLLIPVVDKGLSYQGFFVTGISQ